MFSGYYDGKRVLVTGHTGFKGAWLSLWLKELGAQVHGLSLPAPTHPNFHETLPAATFASETEADIRDLAHVAEATALRKPEVLFHLAAQPLVRRSYAEPIETLQTNVIGTANVLEAVRRAGTSCVVVVITSDKCYENREWDYAYRENDPLGGHDIYSMSKGAAELVAQAWNKSFYLPNAALGPVVTARAGNVIGGGDYAEDRLVPDCMRALSAGRPIRVRNPEAVRPWQHVLESLSGYLWLGATLGAQGKTSPAATPFNFGPEPAARQPVRRLVEEILKAWPGEWVDASDASSPHEAKLLALSIEKAAAVLGWSPVWGFQEAIAQTVSWYRERHERKNPSMTDYSRGQIAAYCAAAAQKGLRWASHA